LGKFKIANKRRDATVTIRGYVYQVDVTLLRWMALRPDEALELEAGEDIDKIQKALTDDSEMQRLFEGVKHREERLTLRSPEALPAIAEVKMPISLRTAADHPTHPSEIHGVVFTD
jgi:hypothetical protein